MNCPNCGAEMRSGFLNISTLGTMWCEKKRPYFTRPRSGEAYALRIDRTWARNECVPADCCPECKRILVDASEYESGNF